MYIYLIQIKCVNEVKKNHVLKKWLWNNMWSKEQLSNKTEINIQKLLFSHIFFIEFMIEIQVKKEFE